MNSTWWTGQNYKTRRVQKSGNYIFHSEICKWHAEGKSNKVSGNEDKAGTKFKKTIEHDSYVFQIAPRTSIKICVTVLKELKYSELSIYDDIMFSLIQWEKIKHLFV